MLENVKLIQTEFPTASIWIYHTSDIDKEVSKQLQANPSVRMILVERLSGSNTMFYRFCAIDDASVDVMIVRDADSRIHTRDASAIRQFLQSDKQLHILRDHWAGHKWTILGGMWGMKKGCLPQGVKMIDLINSFGSFKKKNNYTLDQNFLKEIIYPACVHKALIQDAYGYFEPPHMRTPFLTKRTAQMFIGKQEKIE